jgi:hypothetical protein
LEEKVGQFTADGSVGLIDWEMAAELQETPIRFSSHRSSAASTVIEQEQSRQRDSHQYDGRPWRE